VKQFHPIRSFGAICGLFALAVAVPIVQAQKDLDPPTDTEKVITTVNKALDSNSSAKQVAGLALVANQKFSGTQASAMLKKLGATQSKLQSDDAQAAWATAYGRVHLKPEDSSSQGGLDPWKAQYATTFPKSTESAERVAPYFRSSSKLVREAAAESTAYLMVAAIQSLERPSDLWLSLFFDGTTDEFERAIEPYLPLARLSLSSTEAQVQKWGLESLRNLADAVSENLPDPTVKKEKSLDTRITEASPYDIKIRFLLFEPILRKIDQLTPTLIPLIQSNDPMVKSMAMRTAESIGKARRLARLSQEFEPKSGATPFPISEADSLLPGLQSIAPVLMTNLKATDPSVRLNAMEALEFYEAALWDQRASIVAATRDSSGLVRWVAARALGKMLPKKPKNPDTSDALPALMALLSDTDIDARIAAMTALQKWGEAGQGALESLIPCISRGDIDSRLAAIGTLEAIKPNPDRATQVLVAALDQEDFRVRRAAAASLGRFGDKAKAAVPALQRVLTDPDPELRRLAAEAIIAIE
jgi:HEAT repeat protein